MSIHVQNPSNNATRYIFSDLVLDVQRGTLIRNGEAIALPKLSYDLLVALVKAAPALMSQQQLMDTVWPNRVIGDETLKQRIKLLRKALNDDASKPKYIEAVRGRGYRLIPQVKPECIVQRPPSVMLDITANDLMSNILANDVGRLWRKIAQIGAFFLVVLLLLLLANDAYLGTQSSPVKAESKLATLDENSRAAIALYERGMEYYQRYRQQDTKIAINFFKQAIAIAPRYSDAYAGLSQAYSQLFFQFDGSDNDKLQAIDYAYKSISYDAASVEAYKALGSAYYVAGWLSKSINALLRAYKKDRQNKEVLSNLAFIYSEQGDFTQALVWHQRALTVAPNYSVAALHLGITLERIGYVELAQHWFQLALDRQPDYSLARYYLGQSYCLNGEAERGVQFVQSSLEQYPNDHLLLLAKALCLYHSGNTEQALAVYLSIKDKQENRHQADVEIALIDVNKPHLIADIEMYETMIGKGSERALHTANLALLYDRLEQTEKALRYLVQTLEQGGRLPQELVHYPFSEKVRSSQVYRDLVIRHEKAMTRNHLIDIRFFRQD